MRAPGGCLLLQSCHPWPPGTPLHPPAAVCDEVPECLRDRIVSFEGTSLIDTVSSANKGAGERAALPLSLCCSLCLGRSLDPQPPLRPSLAPGGYCDVPPPVCQSDKGCSVVAPSPRYWTNSSSLAFSFGAFASPGARAAACMCHCPQGTRTHAHMHAHMHGCARLSLPCPPLPACPAAGSGRVQYRWAVGTTRWGRDVVPWTEYSGYHLVQPVQVGRGGAAKLLAAVRWPAHVSARGASPLDCPALCTAPSSLLLCSPRSAHHRPTMAPSNTRCTMPATPPTRLMRPR